MHSTKQPIVASATNSGNINFIVPTGKIHVNNFTEWLEKHGYLKRGINQSAASRFLRALDPKAVHFTFQTFDDNDDRKSDKLGKKSHGTLQKCWAELVGLSKRGAGVFVTINETNLQGREASDIIRVRALFVDLDGASLNAILNDNEIPKP